MKNLLQTLLYASVLLFCSTRLYAQPGQMTQSEKTRRFLLRYVTYMDTTKVEESRDNVLRGIEMVANNAKGDWLSQYHAAFWNAVLGVDKADTALANKMLNKAGDYLVVAETVQKNESEIVLLKAMVKGMRIKVNPALGEKLGPEVMKEYEAARKLNPENPRVWLVLGESFSYMPEEAGGGKKKAIEYLETSLKKFGNDTHEDPAWPKWGKDRAEKLLAELKK
ncbi:MAG: hypothetical protein JNL88_13690 [Bacteroidia bacterium]|nr:hypothetical protein [Bacteroidia bacterium]